MKHVKINKNGYVRMAIVLIAIALTLGSCQKYLDIKKSGTQTYIETGVQVQQLLDNNSVMNSNYPSDGQASSDDYYLATNVYPGNYNTEDQAIYTWNPAAIRIEADPQWSKPYQAVYCANMALEALDLDKLKNSTDAVTRNNLRGSALFFRAYALWNVAQLYCKPYGSTASTDPGVPARTSSDLNDNFGRGTVQDTYSRITQDLEEAVGLLNTTSEKPTRPNKASAYAMLARVYLSMGNYAQALSNATASLQLNQQLIDFNTLDQNSTTPFALFNPEVLFHSLVTSDNTKLLTSGGDVNNPQARINDELYTSYATNDLRKTIFFKANNVGVAVSNDLGSSDFTTVYVPDGTYQFTGSYTASTGAGIFNGLTVDEVYLIRAECYARAGNANNAMTDLNTLLVTRWKKDSNGNTTYVNMTATSGDDALAKVLAERRKELVMRGTRWTDARRLNLSLTRQTRTISGTATGSISNGYTVDLTNTATATYALPANDPTFVLLIPKKVIDNSTLQQNSR